MNHIFILSDGSGSTAQQSLKAAMTQFSQPEAKIILRGKVRSEKQIAKIVAEAAAVEGLIVHTVVSTPLRDYISKQGRLNNVETIDLMGPLLAELSQRFSDSPAEKPGLFRELNKAYFQRIEAMEFAFRHDDGQRTEELKKAEIVLIGVSRTFKTPTSIYLAFKGWLAGNVPIVLGLEPPPVLFSLQPHRVFCLTSNSNRLATLRKVRHEHLGSATGDYADPTYVRQELAYAHSIYCKQPGWKIIDVTNKPIEEISSEILSTMSKERVLEKSE